MLRQKLYYEIKPLVPRKVRVEVRGWFARRKRERVRDVWPVLRGSERPPEGWPGWPDGKKFALVLTHDVEGQGGVDKCRKLMELEARLGFRSSFNFIPEGDYRVTRELREELTHNGFEVGVHDLHHDGKLFSSRRRFAESAQKINRYLKDWGAVGFRSGFMLHNLEWLGELDVAYDSSTFDSDPFEPQPDAAHTIFPFWVARNHQQNSNGRSHDRGGYVELPYTLPQDSTLFLLLKERHPDIWFQKLDWIAKQGGMALVNVHPDYVSFGEEEEPDMAFPVEVYSRLLEYARNKYGESFWHTTAGELAEYIARFKPGLRARPKRIAMVTYSDYTTDARVIRYAEALATRGDHVEVLALRPTPGLPKEEEVAGVHVVRLQPRYGKAETSLLSYLLPIIRFLFASSFWVARRHSQEPYDLLHIHNIPDFMVFAGLYPRWKGAKILLDIHDIIPEFYASKFNKDEKSMQFSLLKWMEWLSSKVAHHVIIANDLWLDKYRKRTRANGKCSVFINNVDVDIFRSRPRTRKDGKLIVIFPGGLQWHQGLDIAIRAFVKVTSRLPNAEFHIYGNGNMKSDLLQLSKDLGLESCVRFFDPLPVRQIADVVANADLGVVPKRADSFGNEAYSTKIMEFMSVGLPVVVSRTKIDQFYFSEDEVCFFPSGDSEAMADAMIKVLSHEELRLALTARASSHVRLHSWETRKLEYLKLVDQLVKSSGW